jgi:muconate cycloisomerase
MSMAMPIEPPAIGDPLRIEAIQAKILDIPLIRPHRVAVSSISKQSIVLVRVRTADGTEGFGEGVVPGGPWWGGESVEGIHALIQGYLAPLLVGQDASRIDYLVQRMDKLIAGANFAKAAVEMALWDARGKSLNLPVYELLGGAHRMKLPVTWALGAESAEIVAEEISEKLDQGCHSRFKLKMGAAEPAEDVGRIAGIVRLLPAGVSLAVDLNGAWDEAIARRWLPALEDVGISLIEQPVARWNVDAMARLSRRLGVPIMADESLLTVHDAVVLTRRRAVSIFAQKLAKSGGICAVMKIGVLAEAHGVACYGGTTIESSIGTAAAVHAFCASASLTAGTELFGPLLLTDDLVQTPIRYSDGCVHLTNGPGFGVILDESKVAKYSR